MKKTKKTRAAQIAQIAWVVGIIAILAIVGFGLSACEDDKGDDRITVGNWKWGTYTDKEDKGTSTISIAANGEKLDVSGNVALVPGQGWGMAVAEGEPNTETLTSLKSADAIKFKIKGDGKKYKIEIKTSDIKDHSHFQIRFATIKDQEMEITIPYSWLRQENWGTQVTFDKQKITSVAFHGRAEEGITRVGNFAFTIWDVKAGNATDVSMPYFNQGVYVSNIGDPIEKFEIKENSCIVTYKDQDPVTLNYVSIDLNHDQSSHKLKFQLGESDWIDIFFYQREWIVGHVACTIGQNAHYTKSRVQDAFNRQ